MFSANDRVKEMANSGQLKEIHQRCDNLNEAAESEYIGVKDRLENILSTINAKEDEILGQIRSELGVKLVLNSERATVSALFTKLVNIGAENLDLI